MRIKKRYIGLALKLVIAIAAFWFIVQKLRLKNEDIDLLQAMNDLTASDNLIYFILLLLMMMANWMLESYKWRLLMTAIEDIGFLKSMKAIFSGVTIALFTPNRVGEYGGRVFHLIKADRIEAILLTVVGSYAQLLVTIMAGLLSLIWYIPYQIGLGPFNEIGALTLGILTVATCVFLIIMYLNTAVLSSVLNRLPIPEKYRHYTAVFSKHEPKTLLRVLLISASRYVIFTAQFILLLHLFDVDVSYIQGLMLISLTYLTMTVVPTIAITELGVRGSLAMYFLGSVSANTVGIFTASSILWVINLVIPALFGVIFIFDLTFFRNRE
ncbi:MAG: uncharacterized membrane protein YbhN (UPF0104 family) [Granulosicoccus sp.]|jgi:uncharacterized membrane protein YbhN (UPF0104 family)